jgi:hypothetical protein
MIISCPLKSLHVGLRDLGSVIFVELTRGRFAAALGGWTVTSAATES